MQSSTSELIASPDELQKLLGRSRQSTVCAIDTEADSLHRYRESLCLIQFASEGESVLIDPLALDDLLPLKDFLEPATVWMHGADYDMTMLRREFGSLPARVFDTQIGARLLGLRKFGLANLVEHYFGVQLSKSSQKADWGKRPLSSKMVEYALNDVRFLLPMGERIVGELKEAGRYDWFLESCDSARDRVLERDESREEPWRVQGAGRLDRQGLNYLKELWHWRDAEAKSWDRPSFMVVTNRQLVDWSARLAAGKPIDVPPHYRSERKRRLDETLRRTAAMSASDYPDKVRGRRRRRDGDFDRRVNEMIQRRNTAAARLDIDGSLIASRSMIESLAADEEGAEAQFLRWQKELLGLA